MNRINILKNLLLFGVTACVGETPVNRFETKGENVYQPPVNTTKIVSSTDTFVAKALATAQSANQPFYALLMHPKVLMKKPVNWAAVI